MAIAKNVSFYLDAFAGHTFDGKPTAIDLGRHALDNDPAPTFFRLHWISPVRS
jgi:hypothetical protein